MSHLSHEKCEEAISMEMNGTPQFRVVTHLGVEKATISNLVEHL